MQVAHTLVKPQRYSSPFSFSRLISVPVWWLVRIFGCQHRKMSRPITLGGETYCACVGCGGRRQFNLEKWRMQGPYYYKADSLKYEPNASSVVKLDAVGLEKVGALLRIAA